MLESSAYDLKNSTYSRNRLHYKKGDEWVKYAYRGVAKGADACAFDASNFHCNRHDISYAHSWYKAFKIGDNHRYDPKTDHNNPQPHPSNKILHLKNLKLTMQTLNSIHIQHPLPNGFTWWAEDTGGRVFFSRKYTQCCLGLFLGRARGLS